MAELGVERAETDASDHQQNDDDTKDDAGAEHGRLGGAGGHLGQDESRPHIWHERGRALAAPVRRLGRLGHRPSSGCCFIPCHFLRLSPVRLVVEKLDKVLIAASTSRQTGGSKAHALPDRLQICTTMRRKTSQIFQLDDNIALPEYRPHSSAKKRPKEGHFGHAERRRHGSGVRANRRRRRHRQPARLRLARRSDRTERRPLRW